MDSYAVFAFLLLLAGILILAAEVFIPSGGLLFCVTAISLTASVFCAYAAWWKSNPQAFWSFCGFLLMMVPAVVIAAFTLLPRTKFGKKILLEAPELDHVTPFAKESAHLAQFVGRRGMTQTLLNPGGMVLIEGERHHAFTDGLMVEPGTPVEVAEVRGTRLLVRIPTKPSGVDSAGASEPAPLDFEIPQG
jgi:membrane-bound serine protease (ClpP class)